MKDKKYYGAIFDLDGVIVDTAKYHYIAWKKAAGDFLQYDLTLEENEKLKGVSREICMDIITESAGKTISPTEKESCMKSKNEEYKRLISDLRSDELLPGVMDYLTFLKKNNVKIALGSASKNASLVLTRLKIESFFDAIVDGNNVKKQKPDPEVFLVAAQKLSLNPEDCVVFEDSFEGIKAANNGGMYSVGVGSIEVLHDANLVIENFLDQRISRFF